MSASSAEPRPAAASSVAFALALASSFAGGYGDASGYLLASTFTGHVTGNMVLLALALPGGRAAEILPRAMAIACFLAATAAGLWLAGTASRLLRTCAFAFLAQTVLLLAASAPQLRRIAHADLLLIAALCLALGIQNGMVTKAGSIGFHPTFVTGDFTRLLTSWVRGLRPAEPADPATARILLTAVGGFFLGALTARLLAPWLGPLLPASLLLPLLAANTAAFRGARSPARR